MELVREYLSTKTARQTAITTASLALYGLALTIFTVIASRVLQPERFGLLSLTIAVFSIIFDIFSFGTSQGLIRFISMYLGKNQSRKAYKVAKLVFIWRLLQAGLLLLLAYTAGKFLALKIYHQSQLILPLTLAISFSGGVLLIDFFASWLIAHQKFLQRALYVSSSGILKLIFLLLLLAYGRSSIIFITLAYVTTPYIISLAAVFTIPLKFLKVKNYITILKPFFHFSKWMALWGIAASLSGRIDILLLGKLTTAYETGIYSAASRLTIPVIWLGSAYAAVLTPKLTRIISQTQLLKNLYAKIVKSLIPLIAGMAGLIPLASWLIPFIFGSEYRASVVNFQILIIAMVFFIATIPSNTTLLSLGYSQWIGLISFIQLILAIGASLILIPYLGARGAALAMVLAYFVTFITSTIYAINKILLRRSET